MFRTVSVAFFRTLSPVLSLSDWPRRLLVLELRAHLAGLLFLRLGEPIDHDARLRRDVGRGVLHLLNGGRGDLLSCPPVGFFSLAGLAALFTGAAATPTALRGTGADGGLAPEAGAGAPAGPCCAFAASAAAFSFSSAFFARSTATAAVRSARNCLAGLAVSASPARSTRCPERTCPRRATFLSHSLASSSASSEYSPDSLTCFAALAFTCSWCPGLADPRPWRSPCGDGAPSCNHACLACSLRTGA